jgi:hypothetical protein
MKGRIPFPVLFAIALVIVSLLPLYVERTMTHVMFADGSGGAIWWGWERCSLREFWAHYHYMQPEQTPARWLAVNVAMALSYASVMALSGSWLLSRRWRS